MRRCLTRHRKRSHRLSAIATCATLAMALTHAADQSPRSPVTDAVLDRPAAEDWVTYGRDYAETRFSPLSQINVDTVHRLRLAWSFETRSTDFVETTPLVYEGVMYGSLADSVLFAVNARTGAALWRWDPKIAPTAFQEDGNGQRVLGADGRPIRIGPSVCCGRVNRGVAIYRGKVYAGLLDGRLVALDASTGHVVWQVQAADYTKDYSITMAPRVVKGKVIIGNSGADFGVRGYVDAYDAETGAHAWRFYTVPGDPSKGFENEAMAMAARTWTGEWWKVGGGATVWDGLSYDPALNLLYVGTGNGGPWPRALRSPGGGDNLFVASILALRPDTGEYVWHYQTTPGDMWDYGAQAGMTLADLELDGRVRRVLMQANKNGFFYVLDRQSGQFISAQPFSAVNWATGVDQKTGRPIESPGAHYGTKGAILQPHPSGAHNWQAMSYNPLTRLVYIPGRESTGLFRENPEFRFEVGRQRNQGTVPGFSVPGRDPRSFLSAWDPVQQQERWRIWDTDRAAGTLTTAGNLVFSSAANRLRACHAEDGRELWVAPEGHSGPSPITYMLDGEQYMSAITTRPPFTVMTFTLDTASAEAR